MLKGKNICANLSKTQKTVCLILLLSVVFVLSVAIPTLARYKNKNISPTLPVWDGSIATRYRKGNGSIEKPYIISNGAELAYFQSQLVQENYENTYFKLSHDIIMNNGIIKYDDENGIQYIIEDQTYYVDDYTGKYYSDVNHTESEVGTLNIFNSLNGFKGYFSGDSHTIYGLYISNESNEEVALFTNLEGSINDVFLDNTLVYGGLYTGGLASKSNNSTIKNVLLDGYVIGKKTALINNITVPLNTSIIPLNNIEETNYIDIISNFPITGGQIISSSISGNYIITGELGLENTVKINGVTVTGGNFEIDLGTEILDTITVLGYTDSTGEVSLEFSNLSYKVEYEYAAAGGIVGFGNNTTLENVINNATVYGHTTSGGLVGVSTDAININQSYNVGAVTSVANSGGLIGVIEKSKNNVTISNSYNNGSFSAIKSGGAIGIISNNDGEVSLNNLFDASFFDYSIDTINDTLVKVNGFYYNNNVPGVKTGTVEGILNFTTLENLKDKNFVIDNLLYNEFIDYNDLAINGSNAWIYEKDSLPILFFDDLNEPIANIHAGVYSWNNFSDKLKNFKFTTNITFTIEDVSELEPTKETYYYVSNSRNALTKDELNQIENWVPYTDIVSITEEGLYVIYTKVVDYYDAVTYMNTDLLILDLPGAIANIKYDDLVWSDFKSDFDEMTFDQTVKLIVETLEDESLISSIKYYITDQILTEKELENLSLDSWTDYENVISVNQMGKNIVYVQIIDDFYYTTYINTDFIILDGYVTTDMVIGRNSNSYPDAKANITNKSAISLNFTYLKESADELIEYSHNLMSSLLFPIDTKITLIDNIKNKVYTYEILTADDYFNYNDSCQVEDLDCVKVATYPFTLFKEAGTIDKYFVEDSYYQDLTIEENFTVIVDLFNTEIIENYNDKFVYLELKNVQLNNTRTTITDTLKKFNIYSGLDVDAKLALSSDYSGNIIEYNSESTTNINISSGLNYHIIGEEQIIDTTHEDKEIGLSIKLEDSEGNIVDSEHLKNFIFKINENKFYSETDNIIRINLNNGITDFNEILTIVTNKTNNTLEPGTYYLKISNYISVDGHYYENLGSDEITISVEVSHNDYNVPYGFDVLMDKTNYIIDKKEESVLVPFDILQYGELDNPNIKVSLYKKDLLTAYDQNYSIVKLADYISNTLTEYATNIYYVSTEPVEYTEEEKLYNHFELDLITNNFENTGYKFIFDLYDGDKKVGTIEKYFIVK